MRTRAPLLLLSSLLVATAGCADDVQTGDDQNITSHATEAEVKIAIGEADIDKVVDALGLSDAEPTKERDIYFYETPGLDLYEAGVILRARSKHDDADDSTVKIRPMESSRLDSAWFELDGFKCEIDRSPTSSVNACSLSVEQKEDEIEDVYEGARSIEKLFSDDQADFVELGTEVDWGALEVFGPIEARVYEVEVDELSAELTVEHWILPDGSAMLELSTRVKQSKADSAMTALEAVCEGLGADCSSDAESKTRAALEYFAAEPY
ncbi:MAG: hypothetical protein HOW73_08140 [Polyangiaceae bacterium]|nr:hypothetical protein [Polyangiaceae bacterium]